MITPARLSYGVLVLTIALAGVLHLGAPLLVVLFSYFALRQLYFLTKRKWFALVLFVILVVGIAAAAVYFTRAAILALPDVADTSIPSATAWAQKRQIELPFTDFESLRALVIETFQQEAQYLRVNTAMRTDSREFWQRAEQRNRETARTYDQLGLAEYEAIEGFVRWKGLDS